jgi:PASTA domain
MSDVNDGSPPWWSLAVPSHPAAPPATAVGSQAAAVPSQGTPQPELPFAAEVPPQVASVPPGAVPLADGMPPGHFGGPPSGLNDTAVLELPPGAFDDSRLAGRHRAEAPGRSWTQRGLEWAKERPLVVGAGLLAAFVLVGAITLASSGSSGTGVAAVKPTVEPTQSASADPTATDSPSRGSFTIPDLRGFSVAEARTILERAGLTITIANEPSNVVASGHVMRTDPAAGTVVTIGPEGTHVTIYVSAGNQPGTPTPNPGQSAGLIPVPNLIGQPVDQAVSTVEALGLHARVVGKDHGRVTSQSPSAGSVPRGGTIVITVTPGGGNGDGNGD